MRQPAGQHQRRIRHRRPALRESVEHLAQAIDVLAAAAHAPHHRLGTVRRRRPHRGADGAAAGPVAVTGVEHQRCIAQRGFGAQTESDHTLAFFRQRQALRRVAHHFQLRRRRQQNVDGHRLAVQPFEVVADAHADVELVARRYHRRHVRRHNEVVAHRGGGLRLADFLRRHRNRHHADLTVKVVRHRVDELLLAADLGNAGPIGHRLVAFALERVEVEIQPFARIAARRRGQRHQLAELRQDQVEDLRAAHVQFTLAEKNSSGSFRR